MTTKHGLCIFLLTLVICLITMDKNGYNELKTNHFGHNLTKFIRLNMTKCDYLKCLSWLGWLIDMPILILIQKLVIKLF